MRLLRTRTFLVLVAAAVLAAVAPGAGAGDPPARLEPWSKGTLDVHQISTGR